ncbi:unnamed protein product (macronuclear) [Paramecium tetraurelia]|uniref:Uncharacterized protein n=1 Tax=Paramecium tetraurelia TaxID=5888 RepID=A0DNX1_PARTE|nr:uncharacterized protein GSPATT00018934001 [Paramecium tetraurelia]CAK84738.1 unnamed protein product [Paramecium tetraurelia]|eukprot:XP_001452135.1 hypothetical protein (macronuclear) [Paramecium tetraurelia strain d4-2]
MDQNIGMNRNVYKMKINSYISAVILEEFHINNKNQEESRRNVDQNMIQQVMKKENISIVFTTSPQVELEFIQIPIIQVRVNQNGTVDSDQIIRDNRSINIEKVKGNILYLIDTYNTMIKYVICLQFIANLTEDYHNLDSFTQDLIKQQSELNDYTKELKKLGVVGSSNSTQAPQSEIIASQQTYQLPSPIRIPLFKFNQMFIQ